MSVWEVRSKTKRGEGSHVEASLALHVHEKGVWGLDKALQLVLLLLKLHRLVQQINVAGQNLEEAEGLGKTNRQKRLRETTKACKQKKTAFKYPGNKRV